MSKWDLSPNGHFTKVKRGRVLVSLKSRPIKIFIIVLFIIILLIVSRGVFIQVLYPKKYSEYVNKYANEYNVDENLIYAVIKAESNFNNEAKSNKNAIGLMQLMEDTAKDILKKVEIEQEEDIQSFLIDAENNINLGTKYISILLNRYNNIELAVASYNAGIGTVDNWIEKGIIKQDGSDIENIPYKETNNYVRKIMRDYEIYKSIQN